MTQEDWTKMNKESHYNSLIKQDTANRKLIKKLQLEKEALEKQLSIHVVSSSASFENLKNNHSRGAEKRDFNKYPV